MTTSSGSNMRRGVTTGASLLVASALCLGGTARANTVTVGGSGAAAPTLSVGVSMASNGDSVLVHPGSYYEVITTTKSLILVADGAPGSVVLDGGSFTTVLKFQNVTGDVTIQGFALRNGSASRGGGLVLDNVSGNCNLIDCEFSGNIATTSGGAVDCVNSTATFTDCTFDGNGVTGPSEMRGGAVSGRANSSLSFAGCSFSDNDGSYGGAIYSAGALPSVSGCSFTHNDALRGGAVYVASASSAVIDGCTFESCSADDFGGALFFTGSGYEVTNSTFHSNDCSTGMGGAIYCAGGSGIEVRGNVFNANSAQSGGALAGAPSLALVEHNTFYGNSASDTGAHLFSATSRAPTSSGTSSPTPRPVPRSERVPSAPTFHCNDFWNNGDGNFNGVTDPMGDDGNFAEDPLYCDAAGDDFGLDMASACYVDNVPSECSGFGMGDIGAKSGTCGASRVEPTTWGAIKARFK
ncbi:MAG: right-handed parallel beta-helix repeat-containing protein [Candidatus Eisenbacteria bacterium]